MARSRMTKGAALAALDQLIAEGQRLHQASDPDCAWPQPEEEAFVVAQLGVERLVWAQALRALFPQMSKGMQLAADFRRASNAESFHPAMSLADDRLRLHVGLAGELKVLMLAVERWRRSGTRPLNESALGGMLSPTGPIAEGAGVPSKAVLPGVDPLPPIPLPPPLPPVPTFDEPSASEASPLRKAPKVPGPLRPATAPIHIPGAAKKPSTGRISPPH